MRPPSVLLVAAIGLAALLPDAHAAPTQGRSVGHTLGRVAEREILRARAKLYDLGAAAVGVAELAGLRYPVKPYQARVSATLARGSRLEVGGNRAAVADLKARGFRGILALTAEGRDDEASARALGLRYQNVPILDNTSPSLPQVRSILAFMTDPASQPVYVHCQAGQGRTGVAVAAYRMAVEGWSASQALVEARSYGLRLPNQRRAIREIYRALKRGELEPPATAHR